VIVISDRPLLFMGGGGGSQRGRPGKHGTGGRETETDPGVNRGMGDRSSRGKEKHQKTAQGLMKKRNGLETLYIKDSLWREGGGKPGLKGRGVRETGGKRGGKGKACVQESISEREGTVVQEFRDLL